ncbi:briggsae cbr-dct-10 [Lasius niger]|uniref:Briggsae cbr-dct-10 n=1 Tax=Lasius niger TaxID=67767 RepID=A0A0J7JU50_LASNI|nr:briggsae cbr-dct-10 [Lasius niger]
MLGRFLEAVRGDVGLELRKQNPKDFEEAIIKAENLEQALGEVSSVNNIDLEIKNKIQETKMQLLKADKNKSKFG